MAQSGKKTPVQKSPFIRLWGELYTVLVFFTRLKLPAGEVVQLADAARAFSVAGVVVGGIAAVVLVLGAAAGLHPLVSSLLALGAGMIVSGAMHEDGLADTADSLGVIGSEKKLTVMNDSSIGTYGVLALVVNVGLKAGLLAGMATPGIAALSLLAAAVLGRGGLPLMMATMKPARDSGLGFGAGIPTRGDAVISALVGVLLAVLFVGPLGALVATVAAGLGIWLVGYNARHQLGGFSGDVLGAGEQVAELFVLLALAVVLGA